MLKPTVGIVDDHEFYRNGLMMALRRFPFIQMQYEADDGLDFIQKQHSNPVDIVLMDVHLPKMGGYEATILSRKLFPELKIIILTMVDDEDQFHKFLEAGISGYLLKNIDKSILEVALKDVIEGHNYYSRELLTYFVRQYRETSSPQKKKDISGRELEILQLIFDGLSNQEIAEKLFISVRTVTNHRYNLKIKTSSRNTAGLISYGIRNKLIR